MAMRNNGTDRRQEIQVNSHHHNFSIPKLELPVFDETKPQWWNRRCEKLFGIHQVAKEHKINLAVAYLNDIGDVWYQEWSREREECS